MSLIKEAISNYKRLSFYVSILLSVGILPAVFLIFLKYKEGFSYELGSILLFFLGLISLYYLYKDNEYKKELLLLKNLNEALSAYDLKMCKFLMNKGGEMKRREEENIFSLYYDREDERDNKPHRLILLDSLLEKQKKKKREVLNEINIEVNAITNIFCNILNEYLELNKINNINSYFFGDKKGFLIHIRRTLENYPEIYNYYKVNYKKINYKNKKILYAILIEYKEFDAS